MRPARPDPASRPGLSRDEMESLQRRVAETAVSADDLLFDSAVVSLASPETEHQALAEATTFNTDADSPPLVAGIDQSFSDDRALSAVVVLRGNEVVEHARAISDLELPYILGLPLFRKGGLILDALAKPDCDPDLLTFDGSGRIHLRRAGFTTHLDVVCGASSIGVARPSLCGTPDEGVDGRPEDWRTLIRADNLVNVAGGHLAGLGMITGYIFQSRQYDSRPIVSPLYVGPGHHLSVVITVDLISQLSGLYKLPKPTQLADAYADETRAQYED